MLRLLPPALALAILLPSPALAQEPSTAAPSAAAPSTAAPSTPAPTAEPLSLKAAVSEALDGNLGLLAARYDALLAQDSAAMAAAGYEPQLTASVRRSTDFIRNSGDLVDLGVPFASTIGSIGVTQPIPGGGTASLSYSEVLFDDKSDSNPYGDTAALIVDVRQPLLSGAILGGRERSLADATFGLGDAELDLHTVVADLILEIEGAYWGLVQAGQAVTAGELSLASASHQEAWVQERIDLGFDPPSELLATQERVASAQAAMASATAERANAEARLLYLLGRDLRAARPLLQPTTAPEAFDVLEAEAAQAAAFDRNLETRALRRAVLTARRSLRFTVIDQLPSLDASLSVRPDLAADGTPWTVGLSMSTPLPSRGRVHGILAARARVAQSEVRLKSAQQRLRLLVETATRAVDTAGAQVRLAEVGLDVAQRKFEAEGERLSRGRSTNKTVLDYLEDRDQAVRNRNNSLVALAQAAAQLRRLTGTNLEFWGVDPSALIQRRKELR